MGGYGMASFKLEAYSTVPQMPNPAVLTAFEEPEEGSLLSKRQSESSIDSASPLQKGRWI